MSIKIVFKGIINNESLQVGDVAYFVTPTDVSGINQSTEAPKKIGEITALATGDGGSFIKVDSITNTPSEDDFIMFQKNTTVNDTSLLGYYAEIQLKNNSVDKAELFSLGSEVGVSSK